LLPTRPARRMFEGSGGTATEPLRRFYARRMMKLDS
jgi:hypothetical protein